MICHVLRILKKSGFNQTLSVIPLQLFHILDKFGHHAHMARRQKNDRRVQVQVLAVEWSILHIG